MPAPSLPAVSRVANAVTGLMTPPWLLWCQFFALLLRGSPENAFVTWGRGSPEGVVTAPVSSAFFRRDGAAGTILYLKDTGTGNTGWSAQVTRQVGAVRLFPRSMFGAPVLVAPSGTDVSLTGTTTDGLQEAITYASVQGFDLEIYGGNESAGGASDYEVAAGVTVEIPAMQGKRIMSGAITINAAGTGTQPVLRFDSMMMVDVALLGAQIVGAERTGPIVVFEPRNPVPLDAVTVIVDSKVHITTVVGKLSSVTALSSCVRFICDTGGIGHNVFEFEEINGQDVGIIVDTPASGLAFQMNSLRCPHVHDQAGSNPHVMVGDSVSAFNAGIKENQWQLAVVGAGTKRGYETREVRAQIKLACSGVSDSAYDVYLEAEAAQNLIDLSTDSAAADDVVYDGSTAGTNKVSLTMAPASAAIAVGASPFIYPAASHTDVRAREFTIVVSGGTVTGIDVGDGTTWTTTGRITGDFHRRIGMAIRVTYAVAPTMTRWVG